MDGQPVLGCKQLNFSTITVKLWKNYERKLKRIWHSLDFFQDRFYFGSIGLSPNFIRTLIIVKIRPSQEGNNGPCSQAYLITC